MMSIKYFHGFETDLYSIQVCFQTMEVFCRQLSVYQAPATRSHIVDEVKCIHLVEDDKNETFKVQQQK